MIPLYQVKPNSKIDIRHLKLIDTKTGEIVNELLFHKIDGMYSLCTYKGDAVHLSASAMVKLIKNKKQSSEEIKTKLNNERVL